MHIFRSIRSGTFLMALASLMFLVLANMAGCTDSQTAPSVDEQAKAPVLPAAEQLQFDFSFFESVRDLDKADGDYENFVNAYLRSIVLGAVANLVLVAPVGTFSAALTTVPVVQPDGSWVWTYDWKYGPDPVSIILRGMPAGTVVEWELSLAPVGMPDEAVLWFSGDTSGDGESGHWTFHDLDNEGHPVSGEINWGRNYLEFVCREPGSDGDTLRFTDNEPDFSIDFTPGDGTAASFIRWHAIGEGSLQVPDYNGGIEACWDVYLRNTDCTP